MMPKLSVIDVCKSCYPVNCIAGNIDMLSTEIFFISSKRENPLQHTIGNEMSTLARFTFYENLLIGQQKSVHCLH